MSQELARQVVVGIALIAFVVWLISLNYLVSSARRRQPVPGDGSEAPTVSNLLAGTAEVDGDPRALAGKAAVFLAGGAWGPLKILKKSADQIVFERLDAGLSNQPPGRWFRHGELRFTAAGPNRTRVEWAAEPAQFQWMLRVGGLIQVVGLVALLILGWVLFTFVAGSPNPAVRWQSLQMLQVIHFLWPPFLFAGLYRKGLRGIATEFDALATNLPYLAERPEPS